MNIHPDPEKLTRKALLEYCYSLEERLRVEADIASEQAVANLRRAFWLTTLEANLLALFADGRIHSKDGLLGALYAMEADAPDLKIINVLICKIRGKLAGSAIVIQTQWGTGYFIKDTAPLKAVMNGEPVEPGEAYTARVGRPLATSIKTRPGQFPARVARYLLDRASADGVVKARMREISNAVPGCYGSGTVRAMERSNWLKVLHAPRPGGSSPRPEWTIQLLQKSFDYA